jgi:hypothetical protein
MFRYDNHSISQREQRGFSWANHSLMAVAHRLLRPVNAHRKQDQKLFVNIADVDFKYVTIVVVLVGTALCVFYIFCMPSYRERTNTSDALEYAMLLLLILILTPLAFTYFFVWLLYPLVMGLRLVLKAPPGTLQRIGGWTWFFTCVFFLCFTFPLPAFRAAQAAGSTLMACLLLLVGIGWHLRAETRKKCQAQLSPEDKSRLDSSTIR